MVSTALKQSRLISKKLFHQLNEQFNSANLNVTYLPNNDANQLK